MRHQDHRDLSARRPTAWRRRRVLAWCIRAITLSLPVMASIAVGIGVGALLPSPDGVLGTLAWYLTVLAASMATLIVVDRAARRLLPLAVLLRLTLVFPDHAPSRLAVALRASNARKLHEAVQALSEARAQGDPTAVVTLAAALNAHDRRTRGHSDRVRALTDLVAEELGLSQEDTERLRWAAFLHDIGKLTVPAKILNKPGGLDETEWHTLHHHPEAGERLAAPLGAWLGDWIHGIGQHHERFDGSGYPFGLRGEDITLAGRVVAVTDAFETMTAVRSYNKPMTPAQARAELTRCAGKHFDPRVVRAFLAVSLGRLRWTIGGAALLAQLPFVGATTRAGAQLVTLAGSAEAGGGTVVGAIAAAISGVATPVTPVVTAVAIAMFATGGLTDSAAAQGHSIKLDPLAATVPVGLGDLIASGVPSSSLPAFSALPLVPAPSPPAPSGTPSDPISTGSTPGGQGHHGGPGATGPGAGAINGNHTGWGNGNTNNNGNHTGWDKGVGNPH